MKGVESLLADIGQSIAERRIESDSMAALSISSGSSSWRTRHLRIKANWLQEQISYGLITVQHCRGEVQPADLLTKALSYARLTTLLGLWGVGQDDEVRGPSIAVTQGRSRMTVALVCCLLLLTVQAAEEPTSPYRGGGIQVDSDLVGTFMLVLMGLGALLIWEGLKWLCDELYHVYTPGASKRRLRKLRKLQQATTEAIEKELERLHGEQTTAIPRRPMASSTMSSTTPTLRLRGAREEESARPARSPADYTPEHEPSPDARQGDFVPTSTPERLMRPTPPMPSRAQLADSDGETQRACEDVCKLMTCECLREALRSEGLPVSGLKDDQARRLGARLAQLVQTDHGPTARQLRYVLWLWRDRDMSGRHTLHYYEVCDKRRISALIAQWTR